MDLTAAGQQSDLIAVPVVLGGSPDVVLDSPHFVKSCFLVVSIGQEDLAPIDLHAVSGEAIQEEEGSVRVSLESFGDP